VPIMGTKSFWMSSSNNDVCQKEEQVLKNAGYINIQLYSAHYKASGNFWQQHFGGSDKIVLSTSVKYQTSTENIEAIAIQDIKVVDINQTHDLGLQRNIAIKIPAHADALELATRITAVKNDKLQEKFQMLNSPEFQTALQLTPTIIGQVLTITTLAKKLFTETGPGSQLEATYAGIISSQHEEKPVENGKLTPGYLILISSDEGQSFSYIDQSQFNLKGNTLYYDSTKVTNTNIIFLVSFEKTKGIDENSIWFRKYTEAINCLDKIYTADNNKIVDIYKESMNIWIQGNALLEADPTFLFTEKVKIKNGIREKIWERYLDLTAKAPSHIKPEISFTTEMLTQITGAATAPKDISIALPSTAAYLEKHFNLDPDKPFNDEAQPLFNIRPQAAINALKADTEEYIRELRAEGKDFSILE